jgi:hypothetical protein
VDKYNFYSKKLESCFGGENFPRIQNKVSYAGKKHRHPLEPPFIKDQRISTLTATFAKRKKPIPNSDPEPLTTIYRNLLSVLLSPAGIDLLPKIGNLKNYQPTITSDNWSKIQKFVPNDSAQWDITGIQQASVPQKPNSGNEIKMMARVTRDDQLVNPACGLKVNSRAENLLLPIDDLRKDTFGFMGPGFCYRKTNDASS